jgi:hypothetical protein
MPWHLNLVGGVVGNELLFIFAPGQEMFDGEQVSRHGRHLNASGLSVEPGLQFRCVDLFHGREPEFGNLGRPGAQNGSVVAVVVRALAAKGTLFIELAGTIQFAPDPNRFGSRDDALNNPALFPPTVRNPDLIDFGFWH